MWGAMAGQGSKNRDFQLRFWGVRGGIPTTKEETFRFGGNTPCVEVHCGNHLIILECGTGIRPFGSALDQSRPIHADIFFSVSRFDHACGLPFFNAAYNPANEFKVWAGHLGNDGSIQRYLTNLMSSPLFPIQLSFIRGLKEWGDFVAGDSFELRDGISVKTATMNNPIGATGYRIEYSGKALGYVNNTGHEPDQPDKNVLELIENCDLVIYDSYYFGEEFINAEFTGHSTWQEGVRLCKMAGAKHMAAFQHHPDHFDDALEKVQGLLETRLPGSCVAYEGQVIRL